MQEESLIILAKSLVMQFMEIEHYSIIYIPNKISW